MRQLGKKNEYKECFVFNYIILITTLAILLFFYGFFPTCYTENIIATKNDVPNFVGQTRINLDEVYKPAVKKLIIMVIDALRWDFVAGSESNKTLPNTKNLLINERGCLFKTKVQPPTVTMPRIKAITTGSVPNFVDIVLNLDARQIVSDSILTQTRNHGYNTVFYGDDTWSKLFPNMFYRHEATSSFFVSDFVEVDTNVTRNLNVELNNEDWSIMILHYLGLDHIGHLHGPHSSLVLPKLQEMDEIIGRIENFASDLSRNGNPTMFLVMGDHGMKDSGSHGGATSDETLVAMMSFGTPCNNKHNSNDEIDQIDIASTLSVLLGIPIPKTNLGSVILDLLEDLPDSQKLFALHYNAEQLLLQFKKIDYYQRTETYKQYKNVVKQYSSWLNSQNNANKELVDNIILNYQILISNIKKALMQLFKYNIKIMTVAITILCQILYILVTAENKNMTFSVQRITVVIIFSYIFWTSLTVLLTSKINFSVFLEGPSWNSNFITVISISILLINCLLCSSRTFYKFKLPMKNDLESLLFIGSILQTLSLSSTSYIEEEHQMWYFLWISLLVYLTYNVFTKVEKENRKKWLISLLFMIIIHRFLRNLNSTGVMYADLPDVSDWLQQRDNNFAMTCILVLGLQLLAYLDFYWGKTKYRMIDLCFNEVFAFLIYLKHAASNTVLKPKFFFESRGLIEVYCLWTCLLVYFIYSIVRLKIAANKRNDIFSLFLFLILKKWVLISCILHRPYNVILLPTQLLVGIFIHYLTSSQENNDSKLFLYVWSSSVFYFFQGNSNSLSTVDVAAGFVGLETYRPIIVGIYLCINTYSAPILGFLMYLHDHSLQLTQTISKHMIRLYRQYAFWRMLPMIFYMILISFQRYHLSIWTVFSPKLLYETMHTSVLFLFMLVLQVTYFLYNLIIFKI